MMAKSVWALAIAALLVVNTGDIVAQEEIEYPQVKATEDEDYYYQRQHTTPLDSRAIVRQRAMLRGEQRSTRLASLAWAGVQNGRPMTPFSGAYPYSTRKWMNGWPTSWYVDNRPNYMSLPSFGDAQ